MSKTYTVTVSHYRNNAESSHEEWEFTVEELFYDSTPQEEQAHVDTIAAAWACYNEQDVTLPFTEEMYWRELRREFLGKTGAPRNEWEKTIMVEDEDGYYDVLDCETFGVREAAELKGWEH